MKNPREMFHKFDITTILTNSILLYMLFFTGDIETMSDVNLNEILSSIKNINKTMIDNQGNIFKNHGKNVADISECAFVSKGPVNRDAMLKTDWRNYNNCTHYPINEGFIQVNFRMPFMINTIQFLLWDMDDRHYGYRLEISRDGKTWESIGDDPFERCSSWQIVTFVEKFVKHVRLFGTHNSARNDNYFHVVKFIAFYDYYLSDEMKMGEACVQFVSKLVDMLNSA